ncbi:MAG TPA: GFA family protein [Oligoflexia bacterium]|nr:GFA family protein [Oligoflexia bacterium]HMR25802.1 GFA family protein [Oligoflexia bacterium]
MKKYKMTCHCAGVEIEVQLNKGLEKIRRCNCSICSRKGAVVASVPLQYLKVVKGQDLLQLYTFNTHTAKHYFCKVCGIYTHHQRRSDPTEYGINIACIDGVNIENYKSVPYSDGINHPKDV